MKHLLLVITFLIIAVCQSPARDYTVSSPDGKIRLAVSVGEEIKWSASFEGREIIGPSKAAMLLADGRTLGANERVRRSVTGSVNEVIIPEVPHKRSEVLDYCSTLTLTFRSGFALQFRVYNEGIAYRFETSLKGDVTVKNEEADIKFLSGSEAWYPLEQSFMSHNERQYIYADLDTIGPAHLASLPALFQSNGVKILITESNIKDYPGMWLRGGNNGKVTGVWPLYPASEELKGDRNLFVTSRMDYIAKTSGTRTYPWRVFAIAPEDADLIENDMVWKLADPKAFVDTDWIKPGKVAWDWWSANNIFGVDFRAGINNDTYKYYIDFASANGLEYIILDEGWYRIGGSVLESVPEINVPELCRYGAERNVGVILWVVWKTFYDEIDKAVALYEKWGVKGVKVDFMQRDDQKMVNFYHEAARKTAEHHLLINFHGSYKPDGFGRTYPNALTREGVMGMENSKWSRIVNPEYDVTVPFIRMVAGPMDYTPGALVNMDSASFNPVYTRPASQGTRVHQMALYVIFESPLQMLSDTPSAYMKEQECTDFIAEIPVVWDDIRVLKAKLGDYILLARRSGKNWFVGGISDWNSREMELDLSFLPPGEYQMDIFRDGINADRHAQDFRHIKTSAASGEKMKINMAPGGGWVAKISPR